MTQREPTLSTLIIDAIQSRLLDFHVMLPAKITKYTASDNTVEVALLLKEQRPQSDGTIETEDFPPIADVPVAFQKCAGGWLTWPLAVGDTGMVIFADRSLSNWSRTATGQVVDAKDLGMHNLSGAVFVPGLSPPKNPIASPSEQHVVLHTESELHLGEKGLSADNWVAVAKLCITEMKALRDAVQGASITSSCTAGGAVAAIAPGTLALAFNPSNTAVAATKVKVK